jgi:hypothetical protein
MFKDGILRCSSPLCGEVLSANSGNPEIDKRITLDLARRDGWHIPPCECPGRDVLGERWRHRSHYCRQHFPIGTRKVTNLPALLPGFTVH